MFFHSSETIKRRGWERRGTCWPHSPRNETLIFPVQGLHLVLLFLAHLCPSVSQLTKQFVCMRTALRDAVSLMIKVVPAHLPS